MLRIRGAQHTTRPDTVAAEEPLEIRLDGTPLAVTMRTPGDDFDLAAGFLVSEGVISAADDVVTIRYCDEGRPDPTYNVLDVTLAPHVVVPDFARNFYTSSSCGVCGKDSLDAVRTTARWSVADDPVRVSSSLLSALPGRLREVQEVFDRTGGLHAAGLFSATGDLLCVREDVGRHNAMDKVVGWALRQGLLPLHPNVLCVSGRLSFELVQKAAVAGAPLLVGVGAPTSLAVKLADDRGLTLCGFARGGRVNVYTYSSRVV